MNIFPFAIFKVEGESMLPDFRPGDFVVANLLAYIFKGPRAGDAVILSDPRKKDRMLLKRVLSGVRQEVFVLGDNPQESTDSRAFGLVAKEDILGKVFFHARP